jgi:hypothetical protein
MKAATYASQDRREGAELYEDTLTATQDAEGTNGPTAVTGQTGEDDQVYRH